MNRRPISEGQFQRQVEDLCKLKGLLHYHVIRSDYGKVTSKGFPDLVIVGNRIIYAELKTEVGRLTAHQRVWEAGIIRAGGEHYIWRPSDLPKIVRILDELRVGAVTMHS